MLSYSTLHCIYKIKFVRASLIESESLFVQYIIMYIFRRVLCDVYYRKIPVKFLVLSSPACPYWRRSIFDPLWHLYQVHARNTEKNWWSILETRMTPPIFNQFISGLVYSVLHLIMYDIKETSEFFCYILAGWSW